MHGRGNDGLSTRRRVSLVVLATLLAWVAMLQAFASQHAAASAESVDALRAELASLGSSSSRAADARKRWAAQTLAVTREARGLARDAAQGDHELQYAVRSLDDATRAINGAIDDDAESADGASLDDQLRPLFSGDVASIDAVIESAGYGAEGRGADALPGHMKGNRQSAVGAAADGDELAEAHRALLRLALPVLRLAEYHCGIVAWREYLAPFIKAAEGRKDRMLYNYI
jgi:hypothetical protein